MFSELKNINTYFNLYLHSLILFTFLSFLFITLITKVSTNTFNNEISHISIEYIEKNKELINNDKLKIFPKDFFDKILSIFNKPNKTIMNKNNGIKNSVIILNVTLWIMFIVCVVIAKLNKDTNLKISHLIFENIFSFIFIGAIEYLFFTKIIMFYIPVQPSFISKIFLQNFQATLN